MGVIRLSARNWERNFRGQIEPEARAPQIVAELRDKSAAAAKSHIDNAVRIMVEHG